MPRIRKPIPHAPIDVFGRNLRVGDWVRVTAVPDLSRMPRSTKRVFSFAVGQTFQIEAFDELGEAELDLWPKVGRDTIWIEPFCVKRTRRPRNHSQRFKKVLAIRRKVNRPRWSFDYVLKYRREDNPSQIATQLSTLWIGHGWHALEKPREIHGTFRTTDNRLSSKRLLEQLRKRIRNSDAFVPLRIGRIQLKS